MEWKRKNRFLCVGILGSFLGMSLFACGGTAPGSGSTKCSGLNEGDFVITEFLVNPKGVDDWQEYVEIYNPTLNPIKLQGVKLFMSKNDGSSEKSKWTINEATIQPGQYFTVGDFNTTPDETTGVAAQPYEHLDYIFETKLSLLNSNGLIGFRCGTTVIDQVTYTSVTEAQAQILSGDKLSIVENDDEANWCSIPKEDEYIIASLPYVSDSASAAFNYGTPKQANPICEAKEIPITVPEGQCVENGETRDIVPPQVGDVIITEIMSWAEGNDKNHEYVELYAKASFDLNGLILSKGTKDWTLASNACLHVTANEYVIIAGTNDGTLNGGIPNVDVSVSGLDINQDGTLTLRLDDATILDDGTIGDDATILDSVSYTKPTMAGVSWQLSSDKFEGASGAFDADFCASTAIYSEGHYGTPGSANATCGAQPTEGQCLGADGSVRQIVSPASGDLLITEIMVKPTGENTAQWFEIYARNDVDLNNIVIKKGETTTKYTIKSGDCLSLSAGKFAVVATVEDVGLGADVVVVPTPKISLNSSSNRNISIYNAADVLIDSYNYTTPADGVSLQLTSTKFSSAREEIDSSADYCASAGTIYDTIGNVGTPGKANAECATAPGPASCSGISAGALVITEVMANPVSTDDWQEYVEVYNPTSGNISLNGVIFTRATASGGSSNSWTFGDASIAAGQYFVFGDYNGASLPAHLDYAFASRFALPNGGGSLSLTCGEVTIDAANYPDASSAAGQALILTTVDSTANDDASHWCFIAKDASFAIGSLAGSYGTPGHAGGTCAQ